MAHPDRQKLPKFMGNGSEDPVRHCKTCETIWIASGQDDPDQWLKAFPATLRESAIDWYSELDQAHKATWRLLKKAFQEEFKLLRNDSEIVAEIYNTKQGKHESVRTYNRRLKDLLGKLEAQPADGLKKRWFIEGLLSSLRKKMKVVPPSSYAEAYNRAMDIESENKTSSRGKKKTDDEESTDDSDGESKTVQALRKDMMRMMKELKADKESTREARELWCTDCNGEGHTKANCPKNLFCDICQVMGHSVKECPYNLKARSAQVLFAQGEPSTPPNTPPKPQYNSNASPGGYRSNRSPRNMIQYDAKGRPMIQCRKCNEWGHFARDCQNGQGSGGRLCKWCGPGDHEDNECPKQKGIHMLEVEEQEVLAITRAQAKKATYPDPCTEKQRMKEAKTEVELAMAKENKVPPEKPGTSRRSEAETNIIRQVLQTTIPIKVTDLLQTMPQLGLAITNVVEDGKQPRLEERRKELIPEPPPYGEQIIDPVLLTANIGKMPAVVHMEIRGNILTNTIVDGGSGVNVLPEDTWKSLGKPTLWPPTFQLVGADQHGIKPLGTLMAQKVTIGTQQFLLNFVVIPLQRKAYDALLGRGWLIAAKANHNWKRNTLSIENNGRKYVIDLKNQAVSEELASSGSESDGGESDVDEGRKAMEPNTEGVLELESCSEDETSSLNGLFHWQMEDYEVFHRECNMLQIGEIKEEEKQGRPSQTFPAENGEYKERVSKLDDTPVHKSEQVRDEKIVLELKNDKNEKIAKEKIMEIKNEKIKTIKDKLEV